MDRRKELKEQYKERKPDMGIFRIHSNSSNKDYMEASQNLKATINKTKFQLHFNNFSNKELQKEWNEQGEENFTIEILEHLKYDTDESKVDYTEDLAILKMIWEERLSKQGVTLYEK